MRNQSHKFFQLLLLNLLLIPLNIRSQTNQPDSLICLEITGKVTNIGNKSDDNYKIELIYYNKVTITEIINTTKSFKFKLNKDAIYTIRISKAGYIPKLVSIFTEIPKDNNELYNLDFETELIEIHKSKKLNSDALDFPITIIYYDDKANWFYFNEEYTSNIKRCIYDVKVVRNKL